MTKTTMLVRNMDVQTRLNIKAEAARRGITMAAMLKLMYMEWAG